MLPSSDPNRPVGEVYLKRKAVSLMNQFTITPKTYNLMHLLRFTTSSPSVHCIA
jgi:hypothetical protein